MRHHLVLTIECEGAPPPGLLTAVGETAFACAKAAGKALSDSTITVTVSEDPQLADLAPPGTEILYDDTARAQHAALALFVKTPGSSRPGFSSGGLVRP